MLPLLLALLLWVAWTYRRLYTMHDPSKEEEDLKWELGDAREWVRRAAIALALVYLLRTGCASFAVSAGENDTAGAGAFFRFWRDWLDSVMVGWPLN